MDYLSGLNAKQREAVCHFEGPLLILAGAGSGKTRVLIHRIAHLISKHGAAPRSILAVTFTNKAAKEMQERVARLLGVNGVNVFVSTFHSLCVRVLRQEHRHIGRTSSFTIFDTTDQITAVRQCIRELDMDDRSVNPSAVLSTISNAKNQLLDPDEFTRRAFDFWEKQVATVFTRYQEKLAANNAYDFDDLILEIVKLFRSKPYVLGNTRNASVYIMVDEYQDKNHAQYLLVRLLADRYRNILRGRMTISRYTTGEGLTSAIYSSLSVTILKRE